MVTACSSDLALSGREQIGCGGGEPCPEGYTCNDGLGRCILVGGADRDAPSLVEGSTRVLPALAGPGARLAVDFTVSEPLAVPPDVRLATATGARLDPVGHGDADWSFEYRVTGSEPEGGPVPVLVTLIDRAGNVAPEIAVGTVRFDFGAPTVSPAEAVGDASIARGGRARVRFTVDEPLAGEPRVSLLESGAAWTLDDTSAPPVWQFGYAPLPDDTDGAYGVRVEVEDEAGNTRTTDTPAVLRFDFTPPALDGEPSLVNPVAREGTVLGVVLRVDEPVAGEPDVWLERSEGTEGPHLALGARRALAAGDGQTSPGEELVFTHEV